MATPWRRFNAEQLLAQSEPGGWTMYLILIVILVILLLGAVPAWPHSRSWGYAPSGGLGLVVVVLVVLLLMGKL